MGMIIDRYEFVYRLSTEELTGDPELQKRHRAL